MSNTNMEFQSTQKIHFNKTETEYNMKSIRFLLLTITTMFIMIASLMIIMGLSVYSQYHTFEFFYESAKSGRFFTPSILLVLLGMVVLVLTSFGVVGSLKQSTCMVNIYAFFLALVFLMKLIVVILAFTMSPNTIIKYIDIPVWNYANEPEIEAEIDQLQISLSCCGSSSYLDYIGVDFSNHSTVTLPQEISGDLVAVTVPESCCYAHENNVCIKARISSCKDALVTLVVQNASVIGVLGVSIMFIQLLGIIFALLLARCIRKLKSEKALLLWKIKEEMILTREADEKRTDSVFIQQADSSVA